MPASVRKGLQTVGCEHAPECTRGQVTLHECECHRERAPVGGHEGQVWQVSEWGGGQFTGGKEKGTETSLISG